MMMNNFRLYKILGAPKLMKKRKHGERNFPWPFIEGLGCSISLKSKIVVVMRPRYLENPQLMILHAQDIFLQTFSYSRDLLSFFPFELLTGPSTSREVLHVLTTTILMERTANVYMNLYRSDAVSLSCHLSVVSITNKGDDGTKWAVFTITSASIVGNSKHTGIGLLGFDRVNQEALDRIGSIGSKAKAKRDAYTIEINELLKSNQLLKAFGSSSSKQVSFDQNSMLDEDSGSS